MTARYKTELLLLDNEVSRDLIKATEEQKLSYQIVPAPDDHRNTPAERAIKDFKAHFISVRACTNKLYPANAWNLLIPHAIHILNILWPSKINPKVSAHNIMKGHHDYNSHPIALSGCKIVIHDRHKERRTWANHGTDGFFISQAPNYYRSFTCYISSTDATRVSNNVKFLLIYCKLPHADTMDTIAMILTELKELLQENTNVHFKNNPITGLRRALN